MTVDVDLQLVNLLQIDPRMSWARAGEILRLSPQTVANRWHRLESEGLAWITTHPAVDRRFGALVGIDCRTECLPPVIAELCAHPMVVTVDEATGTRDLFITIIAPSMQQLTDLIIDWIGGLEGVYGTRSSLITEVISGTDEWRVNALSQRQMRLAARPTSPATPVVSLSEVDLAIAEALARNGRAPTATLARDLDMATSTLHTHVMKLLASQEIIVRCDVAPELAGWQLECSWLATVALSHKSRVIELLKGQPSLRSSVWTTGGSNLVLNFRVNDLHALAAFESVIASTLPGMAPAETVIHLRSHKSMGWLLDRRGRRTGELVAPDFSNCAAPVTD